MFGVLLLALLTALVFLNATARYLFSHSFIWGDELIIALIPWVAMSGLFLAVRRRNVIRIDFFLDKFPPRPRKVLRLAGELVSAVVFVYLAWVSVEYVQLFGGDQLVYLRWPTGVFSSSFVIGPLLAALAYLVTFWREARAAPKLRPAEGTPTHDRRRGLDPAAPGASGPRRADAGRAARGRGRELLPERPVASDPAADDDLGRELVHADRLAAVRARGHDHERGRHLGAAVRIRAGAGRLAQGGLAQVDVLTSIFFGGMIGSSTADLAGTGSITIPALKREGYPAEIAASVTASSSGIGPLIRRARR